MYWYYCFYLCKNLIWIYVITEKKVNHQNGVIKQNCLNLCKYIYYGTFLVLILINVLILSFLPVQESHMSFCDNLEKVYYQNLLNSTKFTSSLRIHIIWNIPCVILIVPFFCNTLKDMYNWYMFLWLNK